MYSLKIPEAMLERWREVAAERGVSVSDLIRNAVNRDIENAPPARRSTARGSRRG